MFTTGIRWKTVGFGLSSGTRRWAAKLRKRHGPLLFVRGKRLSLPCEYTFINADKIKKYT